MIPNGYCQCGCGEVTKVGAGGLPNRYLFGYQNNGTIGDKATHWQGGTTLHKNRYLLIHKPEHPRADSNGYVREHILVTEKVLGKSLPKKAVVHHFDRGIIYLTPER